MPEGSRGQTRSAKDVDKATSAACTKSGAFALALSLVLLLLVHDWKRRPTETALADYVVSRVVLNMNLDQLDSDPVWESYKSAHSDAELTPIGHLPATFTYTPAQNTAPAQNTKPSGTSKNEETNPHASCVRCQNSNTLASNLALVLSTLGNLDGTVAQLPPSKSPNAPSPPSLGPPQVDARPHTRLDTTTKSQPVKRTPQARQAERNLGVPAPPTGLTVTISTSIPEITQIGVLTKKLNDSELIRDASGYSNYYLFSLAKWIQRKRMLVWQDQLQGRCSAEPIDLPTKQANPEPDPKTMSDCLTIRDWRELASFEMPSLGPPDQIGGEISRPVDVSVGALPRRVDEASFAVAALLVFVLLYFGAFLREAIRSENFPADGTLFGAFSRTPTANSLLFLTAFFPFLSCLVVAVVSRNSILYVELVLILLATSWVLVAFWQSSYFRNPAPWLRLRMERWSRKSEPKKSKHEEVSVP